MDSDKISLQVTVTWHHTGWISRPLTDWVGTAAPSCWKNPFILLITYHVNWCKIFPLYPSEVAVPEKKMDLIILVSLMTPNLMPHNRTFYISLRLSADKFVSVTLRVYVTIQVISSVKYATSLPTSSWNQLQTVKSQQSRIHSEYNWNIRKPTSFEFADTFYTVNSLYRFP